MVPLMHGLLKLRVKPYYLYQCDPIRGSSHFRTGVDKGLEIIAAFARPYDRAMPRRCSSSMHRAAAARSSSHPDPVAGRDGDDLLLRNFEGQVYRYPPTRAARLGRAGHLKRSAMRIGVTYEPQGRLSCHGLWR